MKVRNCLCGREQECNGVSAAFHVLEDPRSGYTKVPKHDSNDAVNNRVREAYLRNILPDGRTNELFGQAPFVDDSMNKQYIANHHFHPKIVEQSTTTSGKDIKCKIPKFISDEDVKSLQIGVSQEDRILDENGKPTDGYYIVPNYKFENAKEDLVQTVRARAAAQQIFREAQDLFKTPVKGTPSETVVPSGHIVTEANGTTADEETELDLHPEVAAKDPTGSPVVARSIATGMMPKLVDTSSEEDEEQDTEHPQQEEEGQDEEGEDDFAVQSLGANDGPLDSPLPSQDVLLLNEHIRQMDLSLDVDGSYNFRYQNFDIHMEHAEDCNGSGVLMSTAVHRMSIGGDTMEADNAGSMIRALKANRKLREKLDGAAYIVKNSETVVLYFYTDAPRTAPQYCEFEESFLKFVNGALEMQSDILEKPRPNVEELRAMPSS